MLVSHQMQSLYLLFTAYMQYIVCNYCHMPQYNVCHFDGHMYVLCNIHIKYIFMY